MLFICGVAKIPLGLSKSPWVMTPGITVNGEVWEIPFEFCYQCEAAHRKALSATPHFKGSGNVLIFQLDDSSTYLIQLTKPN